jgi:hypothetical protein
VESELGLSIGSLVEGHGRMVIWFEDTPFCLYERSARLRVTILDVCNNSSNVILIQIVF